MQGFGSMDVLCIDKTGTITNETMILEYYMDILGNDSKMVLNYAYLNSFYHSGIRNPIDEAVLKCSEMPDKQDYYETLTETYQKKDEIPFDYERKCVSVLIEDQKGRQELVLKGEPDAVLKCCDRVEYQNQILPIQDDAKKNMDEIIGEMLEDYLGFAVGVWKIGILFLLVSGILWFYSSTYKKYFLTGNLLVGILASLIPISAIVYEIPLLNMAYAELLIETGTNFLYMFDWIARSFCCSSLPNRTRFAGLRPGSGCGNSFTPRSAPPQREENLPAANF